MITASEELETRFEDFFRNYLSSEGEKKYLEEISSVVTSEDRVLEIEFPDIQGFDNELAAAVAEEPRRCIRATERAAMAILRVEYPRFARQVKTIDVRFSEGAGFVMPLREVESEYLHKLVTIEGLLVRASQPHPVLAVGAFECNYCGEVQKHRQSSLKMSKPRRCSNPDCNKSRASFKFIEERSDFVDIQFGRIQESPEELPPGQIPRFMDIRMRGSLVESARPGEEVLVTGFLQLDEQKRKRGSGVFDFVLETNHIESMSKEPAAIEITEEEQEEFEEFAEDGEAYDKLIKSFATSIHGMKEIKQSLLLALFAGVPKRLPDGVRVRGETHVLLIGDPGTAKSELLKYVSEIAPKGLYTTGRGTTAAGLTAAVVKDQGGAFTLEAGATVLADRGVCTIDEIDKMRPDDRVSLHEALEQQTVSIAKGGIIATLNARTTVLAAANPTEGRYNPNRMIKDNIDLPVTLLSRFDLIHLIRDEPNPDRDAAMVDHVLEVRSGDEEVPGVLSAEFIRKYVAYAKRLEPEVTEEAKEKIREFYLKMREQTLPESPVSISPRQLDSIMRLSEARARADLSETVTVEHVDDAIALTSSFLRQVGMDTESGQVDVDIIMTGVPQRRRSRVGIVLGGLEKMQREEEGPVPTEDLIDEVMDHSKLDRTDVQKLIDELKRQGAVYEPRPGFLAKSA